MVFAGGSVARPSPGLLHSGCVKLCPHSLLQSAHTSFLLLWSRDQTKQLIGQGKVSLESPAKFLLPASHSLGSGLSSPNRELWILIL